MLIIGGGVIGCEIGQFFRTLGTEVTIVQRGEQLLPFEDKDVVKQLQRQFKKDKIKVLLDNGVDSCEVVGDEVVSTLSDGKKIATAICISCNRKKTKY